VDFQEYFRRSKTLSKLRVEKVKTLPLDGYQAMLNIGLLGGEGVPLFCIVSCSIVEKNIRGCYFVSITEEEEDYVAFV
jgi:hypothetical protein